MMCKENDIHDVYCTSKCTNWAYVLNLPSAFAHTAGNYDSPTRTWARMSQLIDPLRHCDSRCWAALQAPTLW